MKLTANRRLAVYLEATPLNTWLEEQYAELCLSDLNLPYRLSNTEEILVWEKIITQSDMGKSLLKTSNTARLAKEAWLLLIQWQLPLKDHALQSEDTMVFIEWVKAYEVLCKKENWVDSATFIDQLIVAIAQKKIALPVEITLFGFEELTPQLMLLFETIKAAGTSIKSESLVRKSEKVNRFSAANTEEELRCAILKSKQWLERYPESRIGIVVPTLEAERPTVVRLLEEVFTPEFFNVAAPISLIQYPLINAALLALSFLEGEIPLEKFSRFLRMPFFGKASREQNIRAALDIMIRGFSESAFTLENVIQKIEFSLKREPKLSGFTGLKCLRRLLKMRSLIHRKNTALFWYDKFSEILTHLKWPGDRLLTSQEFEIIAQWKKLLADYVRMDRVLGEHSYREAIAHLQRLAQNITFAPAVSGTTRGNAPIQVLGTLEALNMPFDYLWVTGLHREAWPTDPAPNPLLPLSLQRQHNVPRSSAVRELKMARQFTERLSQGGKEVIFSYPLMIEERSVSASALIIDFPEVTIRDLGLSKPQSLLESYLKNVDSNTQYKDVYKNLADTKNSTNILSNEGPVVEINQTIKGGTHILKLQALCPFRAFAETRLQAKPLPQQSLGLHAAKRGEMIHQILDTFWGELNNQDQLFALQEEMLEDRINNAIETVFEHWQARYPHILTPQYLILEKQRSYELIKRFIELEKTRPYFEIVSQEEQVVVNLEGLEINIRIDRVDRLKDNSEILVDYKTGDVSISDWFGERPKDPQLPLYCVTRDPKPAGLIFAVIRPDAVKYQGITETSDVLPGVKSAEKLQSMGCAPSFTEQCETWKASLTQLASAFMQGVANVEPMDGENTCRTCSLKPLCRVHSQSNSVEM